MKHYKVLPDIVFRIGQLVVVKPWKAHKGQVVEIQIKSNNVVYYCIELVEPYDAVTYRYGKFNKGELMEVER